MKFFLAKLKDTMFAVCPIVALVLILGLTVASIQLALIVNFIFGSVLIVLGLSIFLVGVELAIMPLGANTGEVISKSNKLWILIAAGLILGFFISLAEPGMIVLANQVNLVTMGQLSNVRLIVFVSIGFAAVLSIGLLRVFSKIPLHIFLIIIYIIIGIITLFISPEFIALAFDSSGATTGILAVPFILALGVSVASRKKDSVRSEEDSFGLVAMASAGAVIGVLILYLVSGETKYDTNLPITMEVTDSLFHSFAGILPVTLFECFMTLLPLLVIFIILQLTVLKLNLRRFRRIIFGFIYSFLGLILFFLGVNGGFMDLGAVLGYNLASQNNALTIIVSFLIGLVTISAEPAVYVQTHQIEDVTNGHVKRKAVLAALCLGVGLAVMLSVVRILYPSVQLWHFLLPGFAIALILTFFVPKLFVGIAFDAGGVATGPMTATFILSFTQGVAASKGDAANLLIDGFGMISLVCMFPIVTLQILGLVYKVKTRKKAILNQSL